MLEANRVLEFPLQTGMSENHGLRIRDFHPLDKRFQSEAFVSIFTGNGVFVGFITLSTTHNTGTWG
jgi:hypothetical protein